MNARKKFKAIMAGKRLVLMPGAYDALSARIMEAEGENPSTELGPTSREIKRGELELESLVDFGDVEEGTPAAAKRQTEVRQLFFDILAFYKKHQQLIEKVNGIAVGNKKIRLRAMGKLARCKVEISKLMRRVPWQSSRWKVFSREIERAVEEIAQRYAQRSRGDA